jgi:Hypothetical glycosyl hydrolase family 15
MVITDGDPIANERVSALHALNRSLIVIPYTSPLELTPSASLYPGSCEVPITDHRCPLGERVVEPARHADWFLHNSSGGFVYDPACGDGINCYLMDPGNPGWIAYQQGYLRWYVDVLGYDGIFADQVFPSPYLGSYSSVPIDPRTAEAYSNSAWAADVTSFLAAMKQAIGSDWLVINSLIDGQVYLAHRAAENSLLGPVNAAVEEGFVQWSNATMPRSEGAWLRDVKSVADVTRLGKTPIGWTDQAAYQTSTTQVDRAALYSLSSYLLAAGFSSRRYYIFQGYRPPKGSGGSCAQECQPADPDWTLRLGEPTGGYFQSRGLFERDFTGGKVMVNPNDRGAFYRVQLDGTYTAPDGRRVRTVTLAPKTGTILLGPGDRSTSSTRIAPTGSGAANAKAPAGWIALAALVALGAAAAYRRLRIPRPRARAPRQEGESSRP